MEFRPCIDIHNGKVKQIVGSSLKDIDDTARENFVSGKGATYFANLYREHNIKGGHIILLNPESSEYYESTKREAMEALLAYPGGMQVGGGITPRNAEEFLGAGASHVIVTSYVFSNGEINYENLNELAAAVGPENIVLDLSCRQREEGYVVVTDRWQKETKEVISYALLERLSMYCDEFLIHAVDVEGKAQGIEHELVKYLGQWTGCPITYAGGVHNFSDLEQLKREGNNRLNVTIGSALDLFGGKMAFEEVLKRTENGKKI